MLSGIIKISLFSFVPVFQLFIHPCPSSFHFGNIFQLTSQIGKLEKQIEDTESETIKLKEDYLKENKTFTELQEQLEQLKMRMMEVTGIPVQEQTIYDLDSVNRLTH